MTENNQEFTDNSYRVFRGLQRPSDQESMYSRYTVHPARNYATIPWWTFRTPVYEDVHVFMGKRTADKATGFSPDPEREDKATLTGPDEEDEDDDSSKRRRNILEEDLNITFEVELDSDDDEDDFRPKVSSTDPTLRVDFKIIRKHSSQSANKTEVAPDENKDEVVSDEILEINNARTSVSLAEVIDGILDSEQENRLHKMLMGGDTIDNKVIPDHDEMADVKLETYDSNPSMSLEELNADNMASERESSKISIGNTDETTVAIVKECIEYLIKTVGESVPDKYLSDKMANEVFGVNVINMSMSVGELSASNLNLEQDITVDMEFVDGMTDDNRKNNLKESVTETDDYRSTGDYTDKYIVYEREPKALIDLDESHDKNMSKDEYMCSLVQNIKLEDDDLSDDDDCVSGIIDLYTHGQYGLECLVQKSSIDSHTDGHDVDYSDSQSLGLLGVYAYGQCSLLDNLDTPTITPHKVENDVTAATASDDDNGYDDYDDGDDMLGALGIFTRD